MGAGLPQHLIKSRIRYRLQKLAREFGGTYSKFIAKGITDGLAWTVGIGVIRASNGETFGMDHAEITGPAGTRLYGYDLKKALYTYGVDTAEQTPEGKPGAFNDLFTWPGFFQTWGWIGCISLDSTGQADEPARPSQGFTLFDCLKRRELHIKGAEADYWAPLVYRAIRPNIRIDTHRSFKDTDDLRREYVREAARADGIDRLVNEAFADDSRWQPSTDWRASENHLFGGSIPFGLQKPGMFPEPGQGAWE